MSQPAPDTAPTPSDPVLVVHRSPAKVLGLLVMGVLGLALTLSGALGWVPGPRPGSFIEFILWAGSLFLALAVVLWARMLLDRRPVIRIGREGLFDRRIAAHPIPWRDIAALRLIEINGQRMAALDLVPGARERLVQGPFQRGMTGLNARLGYGDLTLSATGLDRPLDAVIHALHGTWATERGA